MQTMNGESILSQHRRERAQRRSALNTLDHTKPEPCIDQDNNVMIPNRASKESALAEFNWGNFKHVQRLKHRNVNRRPNLFYGQYVKEEEHHSSSFATTISITDQSPTKAESGIIVNMDELEVMMELLNKAYTRQLTTDSVCGTSVIEDEDEKVDSENDVNTFKS